MPQRYSSDSDDHLMNMLISKGYAFSTSPAQNLKIAVECGCNCNCCLDTPKQLSETDKAGISKAAEEIVAELNKETSFVQLGVSKAVDMWEKSKLCGCDCGCCNHNQFQVRKAP